MKHLFLALFLVPAVAFGQVKLGDLTKKGDLVYERGADLPFTGKAFAYFPSGGVQSLVEYKSGKPDGEVKSWYKKDVKQVEGFVADGKKTGTWKLYFESGKLKKQAAYQNDVENGEEIFWFENGRLQKKGNYANGKLNGKYEWYYENEQKEQKKQEGYFVNGKEDGTWSEWFESGKPKMVGHFTNLVKNGNWTWWDENGKVTTSKNYVNGLLVADKDNLDTYLEKMEYFLAKRNYKESLKNADLAEATITERTEANPVFMGVKVYQSKCYSSFSHYKQGEKVLLDVLGLTDSQIQVIQNSHLEKSPDKMQQLVQEIKRKDDAAFLIRKPIALALCYNILGDTVNLQQQQQLAMSTGKTPDWIVKISLELYKLAGARFASYAALAAINKKISEVGLSEELELDKAQCLLRTERFAEAQLIVDKYLKADSKNLTALLLKADIEMAYGNVDQMKLYEDRATAINPNAFPAIKD